MKRKETPQKIRDYASAHRRKKKWLSVVTGMAAVVVFCTVYALILPAITLEKGQTLNCTYEVHQHTEDCYDADGNVVCGYADYVVHTHDDHCYDTDGNLMCQLSEVKVHEHTASCYEEQPVLVCGMEECAGHVHDVSCYTKVQGDLICDSEDEGHEHTDACYAWMEELSCGMEEGAGAHQHTEDCYETQSVLTCNQEEVLLHTHTEDCYEEVLDDNGEVVGQKQICGKLQVEEHQHGEDCVDALESGEFSINGIPAEQTYSWKDPDALVSVNVSIAGEATADVELAESDSMDCVFDVALNKEEQEELVWLDEYVEENSSAALFAMDMALTVNGVAVDLSNCDLEVEIAVDQTLIPEPEEDTEEVAALSLEDEITDEETQPAVLTAVVEDGTELAAANVPEEMNETPILAYSMTGVQTTAVTVTITANPEYVLQHYLEFGKVTVSDKSTGTGTGTWLPFINTSSNSTAGTLYDPVKSGDWSLNDAGLQNGQSEADLHTVYAKLRDGTLATTRDYVAIFRDEEAHYKSKPQIDYMNRLYNDENDYNKNYTLKEIWVHYLKDGENAEKLTDQSDWQTYGIKNESGGTPDYSSQIRFTNNPDNPHLNVQPDFVGHVNPAEPEEGSTYQYKYTVLINDKTVIRLVYASTEQNDWENPVNFFDYDISDGSVYRSTADAYSQKNKQPTSSTKNSNAAWYTNTIRKGINSDENYTGSGAKYAFGNRNTGTTLGNQIWKGNALNTYNSTQNNASANTYMGLTFGLAAGLKSGADGYATVKFSDGINAPDIFSRSAASVKGLTPYANGEYSLGFTRVGGTYTLSYVKENGTGKKTAENLTNFQNTANLIWSNEFWPLDGSRSHGTDGHDMLFGSYLRYTSELANYVQSENAGSPLPISDMAYGKHENAGDNYNHNSYFGMSYAVEFTLRPGYCAPLNYWFYGDDDMWVFLEQIDSNGNAVSGKAQIIADIGGVHSSVGEYVNLWDYIDPIDYGEESQTYRLNIFYTERGASGSTSYVRFVLPLNEKEKEDRVSDQTIVIEKELLNKEGNVVKCNDPENESFKFLLYIRDENENPTYDKYDYVIYNRKEDGSGEAVATGSIQSSESGNAFTLRGSQYLMIYGLYTNRYFTVYEVGEHNEDTGEYDDVTDYVTRCTLGQYEANPSPDYLEESGTVYNLTPDEVWSHSSTAGNLEEYKTNSSEYNYVRFTNSKAMKSEISPGEGETVHVDDEIVYEIQWANDTETSTEIVVTDVLDEGVDFVAADFRESDKIDNSWQLTSTMDGLSYTDTANKATISYDMNTRTVTWTLTAQSTESGIVSLKVKVNENALTKKLVENQATVTIGSQPLVTNKVENPVWEPVKTETEPGKNETVSYNQTVKYQVTWKNYLDKTAKVIVRDPLDGGVTYDSAANYAKAYLYDADNANANENGYVEMNIVGSYDNKKHELIWNLDEQESGTYGYVEFTVTVNETGILQDEITNQGFVQVGDDPELETNIIHNPTPSVELTIQKVDYDGKALTGAQFTMYYDEQHQNPVYFAIKDSTYTRVAKDEENSNSTIVAGNVTLTNLKANTIYYLVETEAPNGYNLLTDTVRIMIAADGKVSVGCGTAVYNTSTNDTSWQVTKDNNASYAWTITVPNFAGYELPNTGGTGTMVFTISGLFLMAGAVVYGYGLRRRRERRGNH